MTPQPQQTEYDPAMTVFLGICLHSFTFWTILYLNGFTVVDAMHFLMAGAP